MSIKMKLNVFIDRTAGNPHGEKGITIYSAPESHYQICYAVKPL